MKLVYVLEMMERYWGGNKCIKGIFSDANEAVDYVKDNYYLINDERDVCIPNYPIKGDIFQQYGYDVHPSEMLEDEDGLYYISQYDVDEPEYEEYVNTKYKEYVNTKSSFTIRGVVLDGLLN